MGIATGMGRNGRGSPGEKALDRQHREPPQDVRSGPSTRTALDERGPGARRSRRTRAYTRIAAPRDERRHSGGDPHQGSGIPSTLKRERSAAHRLSLQPRRQRAREGVPCTFPPAVHRFGNRSSGTTPEMCRATLCRMDDTVSLQRFVEAQDAGNRFAHAVQELRRGHKTSHWMWFVFPQIAGLGQSALSQRYAIASLEEARAYLRHPVLGPRLRQCAELVAQGGSPSAEAIFGSVDAQKLQASMTLFAQADPREPVFQQVLARYFDGRPHPETDRRL